MPTGPLNSAVPTGSIAVGGVYNTVAPTPLPGQESALQLDAVGNLLVNVAAGGGTGGTQYTDGTTQATPVGTVALGKNPTNVLHSLSLDASGNLNVNIAAGSSSGVQFADNAASGATPTGTLAMGWDSVNSKVRALKVDASQSLNVNVQAIGTVTITGTVTANQGGLWNVNQAIGVAGFEKITDGTNTAAVKAASTAPVATDPALVVAISPNTPTLPVSIAGTVNVSVQNATLAVTQSTSPWVTSDNHFPASVALADNLANPTTTEIGANMLAWDATNSVWRRVQVDAATGTLKVDGSGSTQPVSGTVTANQGGAPWSVTLPVGQAVELLDSGGTNKASISASGALKVDGSAVTQPVSIAATVNVSVQNASLAVTQSTTPWTIQGDSASGAAKAGNPVQVGGVFNTTQPTVTTGQTVEVQSTARGALIVATGVDPFAVTLTSTTITGTVAVTQSTSPWVTSDNHFPASAALSDALANPTTTEIGANMLGWDATNTVWRRVQVDAGTGTLKVDGSSVTQPVSIAATVNVSVQNATLAVTQSTSPWVDNVSQFGGNNVVTGVGPSGLGIPRVTVSNDSNILATQSGTWNVGITGTAATQDAADATVGGTPSAIAIQVGGTDTAKLRALSMDPLGGIVISPNSNIQDLLYRLILEERATRLAIISSLTNGGGVLNYSDFNPDNFQDQIVS